MRLDKDSFGIWSIIAKRAFKATFKRPTTTEASKAIYDTLAERELALYVHIPFCSGTCMFCPYVRFLVSKYEREKLVQKYVDALLDEIKAYHQIAAKLNLKIVDIHAGGGSPSLVNGKLWKTILNYLTQTFNAEPKIAIEANPEDLKDEAHVFDLIDSGVCEVSLGVQSFNSKTLKSLGRRHSPEDSLRAIRNLRSGGCEYINIDMMYLVPGQSLHEWTDDLEFASEQDVDEITCYPTLITPYCIGYTHLKRDRLDQPNNRNFKSMVYACDDLLTSKGFKPIEIYGYSRKQGWKYVTVNYEMEGPLLGLGCGAMGFTGGYEYQNTCSVPEYIQSSINGELPIAGARWISLTERSIRYTTCRIFICRRLNKSEFKRKFGRDLNELVGSTGFGKMLRILKLLGYIKEDNNTLELSRKGLFTAHRICWAFVLNVPCRLSEEYLKTPWPSKVTIP
ncbi:radical SAM protein [Candidatus Bathyarchaeota archaeon]|nr:radical SAM protein [Candidatus Bathyarchaeota archaeon]